MIFNLHFDKMCTLTIFDPWIYNRYYAEQNELTTFFNILYILEILAVIKRKFILTLLMSLIVNQWLSPGYKLTVFEVFAKAFGYIFHEVCQKDVFSERQYCCSLVWIIQVQMQWPIVKLCPLVGVILNFYWMQKKTKYEKQQLKKQNTKHKTKTNIE